MASMQTREHRVLRPWNAFAKDAAKVESRKPLEYIHHKLALLVQVEVIFNEHFDVKIGD